MSYLDTNCINEAADKVEFKEAVSGKLIINDALTFLSSLSLSADGWGQRDSCEREVAKWEMVKPWNYFHKKRSSRLATRFLKVIFVYSLLSTKMGTHSRPRGKSVSIQICWCS
jgi:hypothetical protein